MNNIHISREKAKKYAEIEKKQMPQKRSQNKIVLPKVVGHKELFIKSVKKKEFAKMMLSTHRQKTDFVQKATKIQTNKQTSGAE